MWSLFSLYTFVLFQGLKSGLQAQEPLPTDPQLTLHIGSGDLNSGPHVARQAPY